jgi:hypothetical protein
MTRRRDDPRIDDLLADKLVQALMRADHVEPKALKSLMGGVADRLAAARKDGARNVAGAIFAESAIEPAFDRPPALSAQAPRALGEPCRTAFCW